MSQTNYSRYKYTPDQIDEQEFLDKFVIRTHDFEDIFEDIQNSDFSVPNQHSIIVGQRGQGKTTLLRKVMLEVSSDERLNNFLLPIKFAEEQYQIRSLSRLWEEIADYLQSLHEENFPTILDDMEGHFDDSDYEEKSFSYLEKAVKAKDKRLLLLIDNVDELLGKLKEKEQRKLREILLTSNLFKIIGGSTKMFEQQYDYSKPFYEFFKLIKLTGLNKEESHVFLTSIGNGSQKQKIEAIIKNTPERIETLRRLTGGVPRTLVMLFDIFVDEGGDAFDDLIKVLDDATPLYKHRMDDLPETLQEITHTIAMNWDGITAKEIAKKTRMESKVISAQLKQLETKYGLVESVSIGKNKIYKIEERFFNIWYLMRFGRKKDRQKVEWLVNFLSSWCDKDELEHRAQSFMKALRGGQVKESHAYHMCEALSYAGLDMDTEHKMKEETKAYLVAQRSNYIKELSPSDLDTAKKAIAMSEAGDVDEAIELLLKSQKSSPSVHALLGGLYHTQGNYKLAESFFLKAEKDNLDIAFLGLANLYNDLKQEDKAENYYLKAITANNTQALYNLANFYHKEERFNKAKLYYTKSIKVGHVEALLDLACLHEEQEQFEKAENYFLQAIDAKVDFARTGLAFMYTREGIKLKAALKLASFEHKRAPTEVSTYIYLLTLLWDEKLEASYDLFFPWLSDYSGKIGDTPIATYLILLIAKKQLHKAKEIMEMLEHQLKDKLKPIWYALMTLMQDEFPHEIKKMGSELQESVDEVLAEIKVYEVRYALD